MNVLIIDDEANNRDLVANLLDDYSFITEKRTASSAIEAITTLKTFKADIIFLDVEMPGGSGFSFLNAVSEQNFKVVFITAHEEYAIKALRAKAHDYILKPIDINQFNKVVSGFAEVPNSSEQESNTTKRIIVSTQKDTFFLKPKNIVRISSAGNYCIYHLANGQDIVASHVLKKAEQNLPDEIFVRAHNSHVVNINFIEKINKTDGYTIIMKDGSKVPVSRRKKEELMTFILNY